MPVQTIIALLFCLLLGVMVKAQGWFALLWLPLGFVIAVFATAQIALPIILGLPRAIRLVSRGEMRSAVYGRLLITPVLWLAVIFVILFAIGFFWPSSVAWLDGNAALNVGTWLGIVAILLSPLSKKSRADFRADFDQSYGRFYTSLRTSSELPRQQKYVDAAIKVGSNLSLQTIPGGDNAAPLLFSLLDSRYRYMIFCLSAAITAALAYDEKKEVQPETLINGCLHLVTGSAAEHFAKEYFDDPASSQDSIDQADTYLQEFLKHWSRWPELEKESRTLEIIDPISSMIHTTESNLPAEKSDMQRLGELALWIDCRLPTMRGALIELANR
jgi:hypothetical protein